MGVWQRFSQNIGISFAAVLTAGLCGCGGAGGSLAAPPGGSGGGSSSAPLVPAGASALFHVDVASGKVTIARPSQTKGSAGPNAVFSGSAITFNSSVLLDQAGDVGVKALSVSITNNWALPIGKDPLGNDTGLNVTFGNFANVGSFPDVRSKTVVATAAGTGVAGSVGGPVSSASFNGPTGIAYATNGVFYVTDKTSNLIRKIANGTVTTLAGSGAVGALNGQGAVATFNGPFGIAVNPFDGAIIVSDFFGNRIRRITPTGSVSTVAGTGTAGVADGAGGTATFNNPSGVAVDPSGNIYVADFAGNKIRKIVKTGGDPKLPASYTVSTMAGSGAVGFANGNGAAATFSSPCGVALAQDGTVYVADQGNNAVRSVSPSGEVVTIAGNGTPTSVDGPGNTATLHSLRGVAVYNGTILVSDRLGYRIRQITLTPGGVPSNPASWQVSTVAGSGAVGAANGAGDVATFNQPQFLTADGSGNLYIADVNNNKIRKVVPNNGVFPVGLPTGGAPAELVQLSNPDGILPQTGDGPNVPFKVYNESVPSGATSTGKEWWFAVPSGVTAFEFTVTVEARTTGLVPPSAGNGGGAADAIVRTLAGTTNLTGFNDGSGAQARMGLIKYSCLDRSGNLYFTDLSNNALRRVTPQGIVTTIAGGIGNVASPVDGTGKDAKISSINAVAAKPDGTAVFFGDSNLLRVATCPSYLNSSDAGNWSITTLGGTISAGNANGLLPTASFNTIEGMAMDGAGDLFLSEFFGNRIRKLTYKGGSITDGNSFYVSTFAGDDSAVSGASGSTNSVGTSARFFNPRGVAVDRAGNVFVADQSNFLVRKITPNQVVTTVAGDGTQGYLDGPGAAAKFSLAYGIDVDSSGYIYVGDIGNLNVRRISPSGVVSTVAGTFGSSGGTDGPGNVALFVRPAGVSVSSSGDVYVCDQSSLRLIQKQINTGTR